MKTTWRIARRGWLLVTRCLPRSGEVVIDELDRIGRLTYTAGEAAVVLQCDASWLEQMARAREIPYVMFDEPPYFWTAKHLAEIARMFGIPRATDELRRCLERFPEE